MKKLILFVVFCILVTGVWAQAKIRPLKDVPEWAKDDVNKALEDFPYNWAGLVLGSYLANDFFSSAWPDFSSDGDVCIMRPVVGGFNYLIKRKDQRHNKRYYFICLDTPGGRDNKAMFMNKLPSWAKELYNKQINTYFSFVGSAKPTLNELVNKGWRKLDNPESVEYFIKGRKEVGIKDDIWWVARTSPDDSFSLSYIIILKIESNDMYCMYIREE